MSWLPLFPGLGVDGAGSKKWGGWSKLDNNVLMSNLTLKFTTNETSIPLACMN